MVFIVIVFLFLFLFCCLDEYRDGMVVADCVDVVDIGLGGLEAGVFGCAEVAEGVGEVAAFGSEDTAGVDGER